MEAAYGSAGVDFEAMKAPCAEQYRGMARKCLPMMAIVVC
jgi:hypothetical protein